MVDTALLASQQIALIGRDTIIRDILKAPQAKRPVFILLQGEGGIGKTVLMRTIQEQAGGMRCRHILDFYHLEYQTPEGFAWFPARTFARYQFCAIQKTLRRDAKSA